MEIEQDTLSEDPSLAGQEQATELPPDAETEELDAEATGEETEQPEDGDAPDDSKPKKKGGYQRKIERLEREKFEAQMQADEVRRQFEAYQRQLIEQQQAQQPQPVGPSAMPKLADYDYDEARFGAAVAQWHDSQLRGIAQQQAAYQQQMAHVQAQQQRAMELTQKVQSATEKYPDFVVKVQNPELPNLAQVNPAAFEGVISSPQFAEVAYYLANNPSEIYAFRNLSPAETIRRIAKLEFQLESKPAPKPTKAPPKPPTTVSGAGPTGHKPVEQMSMAEYVEWRRSEQRRA